jgi:hypothetical protein
MTRGPYGWRKDKKTAPEGGRELSDGLLLS